MSTTQHIEYGISPLSTFAVDQRSEKGEVTRMTIDGRPVKPTGRFWTSLCSNFSSYGLSTKLFRMFSHREVFDRLTMVLTQDGDLQKTHMRFALENVPGETTPHLLAVTNPLKPLIPYPKAQEVLAQYQAQGVEYSGGIVRSTHEPRHMGNFSIGPDSFAHQYVMETPIDGFGSPLIYLSLMRVVCSNGAIGYARAFRSEISIGRGNDDTIWSISRALDSFNNEEGYAALRQRFESATHSWASINEANKVYKTLTQMAQRGMFHDSQREGSSLVNSLARQREAVLGTSGQLALGGDGANTSDQSPVNLKILRAFSALTGDLCAIYGLTQLDALSTKKMAKLPCRASMYDLLSFTTEVATHHCNAKNGRLLQAEVGNFVSAEYDLEGTKDTYSSFQDWFMRPGQGAHAETQEDAEGNTL